MELTKEYEQFLSQKLLINGACPFCEKDELELPEIFEIQDDEVVLSDGCPSCGASWVLVAKLVRAKNFEMGGSHACFDHPVLGAAP